MVLRFVLHKEGESYSVDSAGRIGRPAIGMEPSDTWRMLGLVRDLGHRIERVPFERLGAFLSTSPQWLTKSGEPRYIVEDLDHGTRRWQISPGLLSIECAEEQVPVRAGTSLDHALAYRQSKRPAESATQRALFAAMWFIENVTEDHPERSDMFFKLRELARNAAVHDNDAREHANG